MLKKLNFVIFVVQKHTMFVKEYKETPRVVSYCYLESTDRNAYYCSNCSSETAFYVKGFLSERETIKNNIVHYTDTRLVAEKERATYKTQKNKKNRYYKEF